MTNSYNRDILAKVKSVVAANKGNGCAPSDGYDVSQNSTKRSRGKLWKRATKNGHDDHNSRVSRGVKSFNLYFHYKSIVVIFVGILLAIFGCIKVFGFNKGIDFAGGVVVEATCEHCNPRTISKQIEKNLDFAVSSQKIGDVNYLYKTAVSLNYDKVVDVFKKIIHDNGEQVISVDYVSPQMTKIFIDDSIFACIFAFICIGLYIIIRFNWQFALAGILTLVLDVSCAVAFVSVLQLEVCLITLTAILTIIGYCINDKIVVFDRIKENLDERGKTMFKIIAESVKSVLNRSVLTSLTTAVATIGLLFFGDRLIYELGVTVICGIAIGTITSLVFAPCLALLFGLKHKQPEIVKTPMFYAS